jgi:hypothetical protein
MKNPLRSELATSVFAVFLLSAFLAAIILATPVHAAARCAALH